MISYIAVFISGAIVGRCAHFLVRSKPTSEKKEKEPHNCGMCKNVINPGSYARCKANKSLTTGEYEYTSTTRGYSKFCRDFDLDLDKV